MISDIEKKANKQTDATLGVLHKIMKVSVSKQLELARSLADKHEFRLCHHTMTTICVPFILNTAEVLKLTNDYVENYVIKGKVRAKRATISEDLAQALEDLAVQSSRFKRNLGGKPKVEETN